MNEHRTTSILQRVPVILAVTAASYGLPSQAQASRCRTARSTTTGRFPAEFILTRDLLAVEVAAPSSKPLYCSAGGK
jgi:hypothetical protein